MSTNNMTDEFDTRLAAMQKRTQTPIKEVDTAIAAYERLRTARAIATSLLKDPSNAEILVIFSEMCEEYKWRAK